MSTPSIRISNVIACAGLIGAAIVGSGTANATGQDDTFLALLKQDGINVTNAADVISGAHDFCDALSQGATHAQVIHELVKTGKFDQSSATSFLNAATAVYCPGS
jgi:Protein of unknown function (DUF732)